jgi:polyhydroxybutyrate depolymerase
MRLLAALAAIGIAAGQTALAGCAGQDAACEVETGSYHIELPDGPGPYPAVVFLHGAGSRGESSVNFIRAAKDRGYAVIGPDGSERPNRGRGWYFHPERPSGRDEAQFVREVIADAVASHGVDADRVLMGGFSIGGSLASYLACQDPDLATAYAPVGGSFWRPHPELDACAGPVKMFHTHGWRDGTVPLEGRPLRSRSVIEQGDVFYGMQIWRTVNRCIGRKATEFDTEGRYWIRSWSTCEAGALTFALHPGGHSIPKGWLTMVLDWFETI